MRQRRLTGYRHMCCVCARGQSIISWRAAITPKGTPEAMPLAIHRISGSTPNAPRPPFYRTSHTRLNFISYQVKYQTIAQFPKGREESLGGHNINHLLLDRLNQMPATSSAGTRCPRICLFKVTNYCFSIIFLHPASVGWVDKDQERGCVHPIHSKG